MGTKLTCLADIPPFGCLLYSVIDYSSRVLSQSQGCPETRGKVAVMGGLVYQTKLCICVKSVQGHFVGLKNILLVVSWGFISTKKCMFARYGSVNL